MNFRTFVTRIEATHGEKSFIETRLLVAKTEASACFLATSLLNFLYGEPEDAAEGEYSVLVCNGEIALSVHSVREIGLATFLEMRESGFVAYAEDGLEIPDEAFLGNIKDFSSAIHKALTARKVDVSSSQVLNAVASSLGSRNWSQYKATVVSKADLAELFAQCKEVQHTSSGPAIDKLMETVARLERHADQDSQTQPAPGLSLRTRSPEDTRRYIEFQAKVIYEQKQQKAVSQLSLAWRKTYSLTMHEVALDCLEGGLQGLLARAISRAPVDASDVTCLVTTWNDNGNLRLPEAALADLIGCSQALLTSGIDGSLKPTEAEVRECVSRHNPYVLKQFQGCATDKQRQSFCEAFSLIDESVLP